MIVQREASKAIEPADATFNDPSRGRRTKPFFASSCLITCRSMPSSRAPCRFFARISLIRKCHLDGLSSDFRHLARERRHLCALLFIGRCHMHRQQLSQRIGSTIELTLMDDVVGIATKNVLATWCLLPCSSTRTFMI